MGSCRRSVRRQDVTAAPIQNRLYTISEYFRLERDSQEKHEYRDGEILAMAGGTANHSLISVNLTAELRAALTSKPCRVFGSDLRVGIPRTPLFAFPDAMVICGKPQYDPNDLHNE